MTKTFAAVLILAAYLLAAFLKFNAFWQAPGFEKDRRSLYWTESAMHFYMADQVAKGVSLGENDKRAQHPEGVALARDIAPAMPYLAGSVYRIFDPTIPLDIFLGYFFILYSSLTVVGVYLWAKLIFGKTPWPAVASAFLYAVSAPAFVRSSGAFIKEDLALPLLTIGFYFVFSAKAKPARALNAAALVSLALLSWHFSQFMLLCFSAVIALSVVVNGLFNREERYALTLFTGGLALTAVAFPMLRATAFLFSPAMALLYATLAFHYTGGLQRTRRDALTCAVFVLSVLIYFKSGLAEQSHVFRLVIDKLRFFLIKPDDPSLLSYETRSNWVEDFNTPGIYFLLYTVSLLLPLGLFGLVKLGRRVYRDRGARPALFVCAYGTIFLVFFALARRMITIDVIFLSIAAGSLLTFTNRGAKIAMSLLFCLAIGFEAWKSLNYYEPNPPAVFLAEKFPGRDLPQVFTVAEHNDLLNWVRVNTGGDEPVLASMGLSPVILAYTGRPIIIHSMFDAKVMRDKVQAYLEALYGTEESFYDFAKKNGAAYFIYESKNLLFDGPNSDRYVAGKMQPGKDSAVFNFQFHPEKLTHFRLAYQNTAYRVYVVDRPSARTKILPQPVYDEGVLAREGTDRLIGFLQAVRNQTLTGFAYGARGDVPTALKYWEEVKQQAPYTLDIHAQLCLGYLITKNIPQAAANCRTQAELQPHSPLGHYHQALYEEQTLNQAGAINELETALRIDPRFYKAAERLTKLRP